jgi:hypothetical protein
MKRVKLKKVRTPEPTPRFDLFGPPPLIEGEDTLQRASSPRLHGGEAC